MKVLKVELPKDLKSVIICTLADLHIGTPECDYNYIKEQVKYIQNTPNAYCILNGDIIDNSTRNSIGDVYSQQLNPQEQIEKAYELLSPIKDKIIAITNGNHEERTYRESGIDLMAYLAVKLGKEDVYANESAFIFLTFGVNKTHTKTDKSSRIKMYSPIQFTIYCTHGRGGGKKEGAKAIRLADMATICDADIYIHSHTHLPMSMKESYFRVDYTRQAVVLVEKLFVNTGSALGYAKYAEKIECKPSSKAMPKILLQKVYKNGESHPQKDMICSM